MKVRTADARSEPRQPSREEKNRNMAVQSAEALASFPAACGT
jgi:hypothetical protein